MARGTYRPATWSGAEGKPAESNLPGIASIVVVLAGIFAVRAAVKRL